MEGGKIMHILLLSTLINPSLFKKQNTQYGFISNPSNQHFYHSLAKMLAINNTVDVLVNRPLIKKHYGLFLKSQTEIEDNITYHYLPYINKLKIKSFFISHANFSKIKPLVHEDTIIFVDSLNYSLLVLAFRIAKKFHLPIVGVLTDHPKNLTGASITYQQRILKYWSRFDYYYCLTKGLEKEANIYHRPSFIKEGLIDPNLFKKDVSEIKPYLFFGGALYELYGVKKMINNFLIINKQHNLDLSLYIAGHGILKKDIITLSEKYPSIKYLGLLNQEELLEIECHALFNINPRPLNETIDNLSFPSKVLEYIASGRPLISTRHPRLVELFDDNIFWIENDTEDDYLSTIKKVMNTSPDTLLSKIKKAQKIVYENYSLPAVAASLDSFFKESKCSSSD